VNKYFGVFQVLNSHNYLIKLVTFRDNHIRINWSNIIKGIEMITRYTSYSKVVLDLYINYIIFSRLLQFLELYKD